MAKQPQFDIQRFFQALGDNTRLRLLNLMGDKEVCVCYFVEILGSSQPKISRHLAYLRKAGIVSTRRNGKWMHYRIVMPPHIGATQILRQTLHWLREDKAMQKDRARFAKVCFSPAGLSVPEGAPLPVAAPERCCETALMLSGTRETVDARSPGEVRHSMRAKIVVRAPGC